MAKSPTLRPEEARRRAEDRFAKTKQRNDDARKAYEERDKIQQAEVAKTARLRALRIAKEAADNEAAARASAAKAAAAEEAAERKAARRTKAAGAPVSAKP